MTQPPRASEPAEHRANDTSQSKTYFDQPIEAKLANTLSDPAVNQGYTADGAEVGASRKPDHKECYGKTPKIPLTQ